MGKKHKHFHHIENAPVIIKYESSTTPRTPTTRATTQRSYPTTPRIHSHSPYRPHSPATTTSRTKRPGKAATDRPLTESEEEAMYDEEGEISEKEIENAYKNYDDSEVSHKNES